MFLIIIQISNDNINAKESRFIDKKNIIIKRLKDGGLQDSAWPMFGHDVKHTGRSPYAPNEGNTPVVKWMFRMDGLTVSSPAIDENGTIYIGAEDSQDCFFAIYPDGTEKWRFDGSDWVDSSPAIGANGNVYFGSWDSCLYALDNNGIKKWKKSLGDGGIDSSPVIDENGIIYAASIISSRLCAVYSNNGSIKWMFHANDWIYCSPAIDDNGIIYVGSNDGYMYAIYPNNGSLKWKYYAGGTKGIGSAPTIGPDGMIYFGCTNGYLYALYPNGTLKWKYDTGFYIGGSSPAIDEDGRLYIGTNDRKICSINSDGTKNWHYSVNDEISASPVIDEDGVIYCGDWAGYLYALKSDGSLIWKYQAGDKGIESSIAIAEDGTIYVAAQNKPSGGHSFHTYLLAIDVIYNESPNKPNTPSGETNGKVGNEYTYTTSTTDPDGDACYYYFTWGDGSNSGWVGPFLSGEECNASHTWTSEGSYDVKVKAKDIYDAQSDWSDSLTISITKKSKVISNSVFLRFIDRFHLLERLLDYFFLGTFQ